MKNCYYVTTPIYYANGHPHLGNTYTTTLADCLSRFYRYRGREVFFLTGTDEHGAKVQQAADAAGKSALDFTKEVSELFKRTWKELDLNYSRFIRTTEEPHKKVVRDILQIIYDKGDIYFGEYGGNYCVGCERFLTDKELADGNCPDHQTPPVYVKENNYFFKMSKYQNRLIEHITKTKPDFIRPERYKNEVLAMLREPLEDLCISRPKSRLQWGIELPFDKDYVTYVWFDALINYLTGIDYPDGKNFLALWEKAEHLIAKDILKPHGVFWPTMLMAADLPLYDHLSVHGYWITPTGKMSKSLGNVVDPVSIKNKYGMDVFRYFVFRDMAFGLDGTFNYDTLETRYNADLANNLGNLVSRTTAMIERYRQGILPKAAEDSELEIALKKEALNCPSELAALISKMEIHRALERLWSLIDAANVYIDRVKPWSLAKEEASSPQVKAQLDTALYTQAEVLRIIAGMLTAFLPETSLKILSLLGFNAKQQSVEQNEEAVSTWGRLQAGAQIKKSDGLFPRIEKKDLIESETSKTSTKAAKKDMTQQNTLTKSETAQAVDSQISYDDFSKIQLRVGQVLAAEQIQKSEKLLKLKVDLGEDSGPRQIIAGIAKYYRPEELIGRKVAVVANLKPAKLMGELSQGMILAGSDDQGNLELVAVGLALPPGSVIR